MPFDNLPWKENNQKETNIEELVKLRIKLALETLKSRGWCQYIRENSDGNVCLIGAFIGNGNIKDNITRLALRRVAYLANCNKDMNLWQYNDSLDIMTGKYAILDILNKAAE